MEELKKLMIAHRKKIQESLKYVEPIDWIVFLGLIFFCFFMYLHTDILHTGGSSLAYLNGHFLDFYDYNEKMMGGNNYLPTTYIIFAIWNIPLKILGIVQNPTMQVGIVARLWYKCLTTCFYIGTGYVIYKIGRKIKLDAKQSMLMAFLFWTNPIAIFSQFIFGQYDIITAFFMTLGLYYFIVGKDEGFVISYAVALTCKYFALLFFVPLLLIREKQIANIIKKLLSVVLLYIIEVLIYMPSEAFRNGIFGFSATGYIFNLSLDNGYTQISVAVVAWIMVCAVAYFIDVKYVEIEWVIFLLNIVTFICFGLSMWHPQWLLYAVPVWTLGTALGRKKEIYILLDLLLYIIFIVFVTNWWQGTVDQGLLKNGILKVFMDVNLIGQNLMMKDLYILNNKNLLFSSFVPVLLVTVVFKHPKFLQKIEEVQIDNYIAYIRVRYILGILFFIVPSMVCLWYSLV